MSYDRVDVPDSPLSIDSIKSPQFNIETPQYIEYVGGVRIVDYEKLGKCGSGWERKRRMSKGGS